MCLHITQPSILVKKTSYKYEAKGFRNKDLSEIGGWWVC